MQALRPHIRRISSLRPLRPPSCLSFPSGFRVFTSNAPLFVISSAGPRPQLPFLNTTFARRHVPLSIRPLSTEQKAYIRYQLRLGAYWTVMLWIAMGGFAAGYFVLKQDWLDRLYPSPEEWDWFGKYAWRKGREEEEEEDFGRGITDWGTMGLAYRTVILYCEKGSMIRSWAKPLAQNKTWDRTIPGVDVEDIEREPIASLMETEKIGYVVSDKSEPWRRAYFHALMGIAKVAEMNYGWIRDKKRHYLFPAEQMIGPSNPYPKPIWPGSPPAPLEEDCEQAYDPPNLWYTRILTTDGLSIDQRIKAALAYASWLDYNDDPSTSSALYSWSLNLATSSQDSSIADDLLNTITGIIPPDATYTTPSILSASTALASHHARAGNLAPALNTYLSILRARRAAPEAPLNARYPPKGPDLSLTSIDSIFHYLKSLPTRTRMDPPPPSGDAPFERTAASACEDAALMGYIGEILFAGSGGTKERRQALSWTRDAVGIAEKEGGDSRLDEKARKVCTQCFGSGLENWYKMVGVLAREEEEKRVKRLNVKLDGETGRGWSLWSGFWTTVVKESGIEGEEGSVGEWKREEEMVARKKAEYAEAKLMQTLNRHIATKSKWFVV